MTLQVCLQRTLVSSLVAAMGCARVTTIGISGSHDTDAVQASMPSHPTVIVAGNAEMLHAYVPSVGDVDGDGHDDFVLSAFASDQLNRYNAVETGYLFYGRPRFPARLESRDADAVFSSGPAPSYALGDVNGDGFDDMVFGDPSGAEIVFGSAKRYTGMHPKFSTGMHWQYVPSDGSTPGVDTTAIHIAKLGDVNGDGKDEFIVRVQEPAPSNTQGVVSFAEDYVIAGRSDGWPSGVWDPSWAVAKFGVEPSARTDTLPEQLLFATSGDIDGDGYTDIIAQDQDDSRWLFYGRAEGFHGVLTPDQADAQLTGGGVVQYTQCFGDLDGDGADDIVANDGNELRITYGSRTRFYGVVTLAPDLTFFDQGPYSSPIVGDYDADGFADFIISADQDIKHFDHFDAQSVDSALYELRGTGQRLTGRLQLDNTQLYHPVGYPLPAPLANGGFYAAPIGDVDGDGSSELVLGIDPPIQRNSGGTVYLLPGSAREPE
jgi:hypothetical protein